MLCEIRPWRPEDAPELSRALNDAAVQNNLRDGLPLPYTVQDAADYIQAMRSADPHQTFAFAITREDKAIGSIGAFRQANIHHRTAEMGYYVARPFWGRGIGTEAVGLVCRHLFTRTDMLRIFAEPFSYNIGSRRILEKNGFIQEGTLRQNAVKCGKVIDMTLYALLRDDWLRQ